jgi:hypothetical protein
MPSTILPRLAPRLAGLLLAILAMASPQAGRAQAPAAILDPALKEALARVSALLGVEPAAIEALPFGDMPNLRVTWNAPAADQEVEGRPPHGTMEISLFISSPEREQALTEYIAQERETWVAGTDRAANTLQWARYLLQKPMATQQLPLPFRYRAARGLEQARELQRAYDRAVGEGGAPLSPLESTYDAEGRAMLALGRASLDPLGESWATPVMVSEPQRGWSGSGVQLQGARLQPFAGYVNKLMWPCGDRLAVITVSVDAAGLDLAVPERVAPGLAAWNRFSDQIRQALTPALPCGAVACVDPTGEGAKAKGTIANGPWSATYEVVDGRGLTIRDLRAEREPIFAGVRVSHFRLQWDDENGDRQTRYVRFDAARDGARLQWRQATDTLSWCFRQRVHDDEQKIDGVLTVYYDFIFRSKGETIVNCTHYWITPRECFAFIPLLRFEWTGTSPSRLATFSPYYRFDYGQVGLALTQDPNHFFTAPFGAGREWFVTHERTFAAGEFNPTDPLVTTPGPYDNLHTARPVAEHNWVGVPVCRNFTFDCVHTHWRWGGTWTYGLRVDPLNDPVSRQPIPSELRGRLYLAPAQDIRVALVLDRERAATNPDPVDPDEPFTLVNGDELARITRASWEAGAFGRQRLQSVAGNVVVWFMPVAYLASPYIDFRGNRIPFADRYLPRPTFMRQGFFVLRKGSDDGYGARFWHVLTMAPGTDLHDPAALADADAGAAAGLFENDTYGTLRPDRGAEAFAMLADAVSRRRASAPAEADQIAVMGFAVLADVTRWTIVKALDGQQAALLGDQPQAGEPTPWIGPELPRGPARTAIEQAAADLQAAQAMMEEGPARLAEALPVLQRAWEQAVTAIPAPAPL